MELQRVAGAVRSRLHSEIVQRMRYAGAGTVTGWGFVSGVGCYTCSTQGKDASCWGSWHYCIGLLTIRQPTRDLDVDDSTSCADHFLPKLSKASTFMAGFLDM